MSPSFSNPSLQLAPIRITQLPAYNPPTAILASSDLLPVVQLSSLTTTKVTVLQLRNTIIKDINVPALTSTYIKNDNLNTQSISATNTITVDGKVLIGVSSNTNPATKLVINGNVEILPPYSISGNISGLTGGASKSQWDITYVTGTDTYTINHNFNERNLSVQVYEVNSDHTQLVLVPIKCYDDDVIITINSGINGKTYRVIIVK